MNQQRRIVRSARPRRGVMIVYLIVILSMICALASLAVDYGRVQLAKTQLQIATDVAVKWAARDGQGGRAALLARANAAGADNKVNGETPTYTLDGVQIGAWDAKTRTFFPDTAPNDTVKLTGAHVVPLMMGGVIQKPSVTIRASAIAKRMSQGGMIGLNGIVVRNNLFVGSYNSAVTSSPTEATAQQNATVSSNGTIVAENAGTVMGTVTYGPSGSIDVGKWTVTGGTVQLATPVTAPAEPAWNPTGNPGSIPQAYTHNGGTLQGGAYYFTSLRLNAALAFDGPATVYVNGNIDIDAVNADITAYAGRPSNLTIYQIGADRTFTARQNTAIKAIVVAPRSDLSAQNRIALYGQVIVDTITLNNSATFFYDASGSSEQVVVLVQ